MLAELALGSLGPLRFSVEHPPGEPFTADITAFLADRPVASMLLHKRVGGMTVATVGVMRELQRQRIATALYEYAAMFSCEKFGVPLRSGYSRSRPIEAFWKKLAKTGRALYVAHADYYTLTCPPPGSLGRSLGTTDEPEVRRVYSRLSNVWIVFFERQGPPYNVSDIDHDRRHARIEHIAGTHRFIVEGAFPRHDRRAGPTWESTSLPDALRTAKGWMRGLRD